MALENGMWAMVPEGYLQAVVFVVMFAALLIFLINQRQK